MTKETPAAALSPAAASICSPNSEQLSIFGCLGIGGAGLAIVVAGKKYYNYVNRNPTRKPAKTGFFATNQLEATSAELNSAIKAYKPAYADFKKKKAALDEIQTRYVAAGESYA